MDKLPILSYALPNNYAVTRKADSVSWLGRVLAGALAMGCFALLALAAWMSPSPTGMATHSANLGLPACNFLQTTGLPCPTCGMTTSFAWFAKGNLLASAYVQPMGAVLAMLTAAAIWVGACIALSGWPVHRLLRLVPTRYTLLPLLVFGVLGWGWKILIHLNGVDGWR